MESGQIHSNNSLAVVLPTNCLSVFDHFVGLALKGLILEVKWNLVMILSTLNQKMLQNLYLSQDQST